MLMKKILRKQYLALRSSKDEIELMESSKKIIDNLYKSREFLLSQTIMVYVSFRGEVETHGLIKSLLKESKRVCVPLCKSEDCTMTAREVLNFSDLKPGAYGILEPDESMTIVPKNEIDFIIVPGCVFSKGGHRIGYGKGYYDRFLKDCPAKTCGLSYDFCLLDSIPYETTDVPLDMIITQTGIIT